MASFTLSAGQVFPDGTSVGAYPTTNWPNKGQPSGAPLGAATSTATMSNGQASFSGLTTGVGYWAVADIGGGSYRYVRFTAGLDTPGSPIPDALATQTELDAAAAAFSGQYELGYAEITSSFTRTGAGSSDITGLTVTVTVGSRPILVHVFAPQVVNSAAGLAAIALYEGATLLNSAYGPQGAINGSLNPWVRLSPSAGSHTYKATLVQVITGNTTITASATQPAFIQVLQV